MLSIHELKIWFNKKIESEVIVLKQITFDDLDMLRQWRNKEEIRKNFFNQHIISPEEHLNWFKKYCEKDDDITYIIQTREGVPIGCIALYNIDFKNEQAEIGRIFIGDENYLGKGLAQKAIALLIEKVFKDVDLKRISLEVFEDNTRAIRVYEKVGFKTEGIKRQCVKINNERKDVRIMSILKNEIF